MLYNNLKYNFSGFNWKYLAIESIERNHQDRKNTIASFHMEQFLADQVSLLSKAVPGTQHPHQSNQNRVKYRNALQLLRDRALAADREFRKRYSA